MNKQKCQELIKRYKEIQKNGWELTLEQETLLLLLEALLDPSF